MWTRSAALLALGVTVLAAGSTSDDFYKAIRANDLAQLRTLIAGGDVNLKDRHGATPLMYAAAVGSPEAVKMLLAAGADAKIKNAFDATPLMWAAANLDKVRLLVEAGADVNARSKQGMTPLLVAASTAGSIEIVRFLMGHGAKLKSIGASAAEPAPSAPGQTGGMTQPRMSSGEGEFTPLLAAASANDLEMAQLFVEKGVDVNAATGKGDTPLQYAAGAGNLAMVKLLLAKGADVNAATSGSIQVRKGPIGLNHLTPVAVRSAVWHARAGEDADRRGGEGECSRHSWHDAAHAGCGFGDSEYRCHPMLVASGCDLKAKSVMGETALDWARKYGDPEVVGLVEKAGGEGTQNTPPAEAAAAAPVDAKTAIARSIALLQRSTTEFFKESGCVGCHHQNFTAMAVAAARKAQVQVDDGAAQEQLKVVKTQWMSFQEGLLQRLDPPGASDTLMYSLLGLAAAEYPADATTDAMIVNVAEEQAPGWLMVLRRDFAVSHRRGRYRPHSAGNSRDAALRAAGAESGIRQTNRPCPRLSAGDKAQNHR